MLPGGNANGLREATDHRGQIVTLLRQLGVKPPAAGLMFYYRERGLTL